MPGSSQTVDGRLGLSLCVLLNLVGNREMNRGCVSGASSRVTSLRTSPCEFIAYRGELQNLLSPTSQSHRQTTQWRPEL